MRSYICAVVTLLAAVNSELVPTTCGEQPAGWQRIVLSEEFFSEGADFADIDSDGHLDIVSGPYWYAGPEFRQRHAYTELRPFAIAGYSEHFFSFAHDFNADGHCDILAIPIPGAAGHWFENPGEAGGRWKKHLALSEVSNESPAFTDITGDGQPELVCIHQGAYGYAAPNPADASAVWVFHPLTPNKGYGRFTHGLGIGDVDGDGKSDILEKDGWWRQTGLPDTASEFHPFPFAATGGSQMFAYDFDGDGDQDVVSVRNAHGWGLNWFEQRGTSDNIGFIPHEILPDRYEPEAPVNISQMHALALADIDGDGTKDIITGKRYYAHGGRDPGAQQLPTLYWFRTIREAGEVRFEPHLIDARTGVGTQLTVRDCDGNGRPDILVGNKLGTFLLLNHGPNQTPGKLTPLLRGVGSPEYASTIRTTEPLTPEDEQGTFVLPEGFEARLVVSEPQIAKPMNMAFDAKGRLWVTTSEEYPLAAPADRRGRDRIVVLEDRDNDGHRETVTTFADGLNIPMGLYPYRDGVVCFSIPNIMFLRDTDGDGVADTREKLYGPMGYERDTHGMCNGFTRGFDGWLYACHGFNNHTTVAGTDGHEISMQSGNTFRMKLDGSRIEHYTHGLVNPFGMSQSPAGDLFVADCHTKPISLLLPGGYYDSFGKPHDGLGYVPDVMNHLHGSTAIGGIVQYNATQFPAVYQGNFFGGNVMTGRLNRNSLQPIGGSFQAREEPDFLICGDPWFRPVDLQLGPDGALYVADFYNRIIGHYEVGLDHPGRDRHRGRIWKIIYTGGEGRRDYVRSETGQSSFASKDARGELLGKLESANLTQRMLATDELSDDPSDDVADLVSSALSHESSTVRAHACWILHRRGVLSDAQLRPAFTDQSELVRTHAFRILSERNKQQGEWAEQILDGLKDSDASVRRAAVHAAARQDDSIYVVPLLQLYHSTPAVDVHLRHAIRMTLKELLKDSDRFVAVTANAAGKDVPFFADICLALKTEVAGEFLIQHLDELSSSDPDLFTQYVQFAIRYVKPEDSGQVVDVVEQRFDTDIAFQIELLNAAHEGMEQRGTSIPEPLRKWAGQIVSELLQLNQGRLPPSEGRALSWSFTPLPEFPDESEIFTISTIRKSADGRDNMPLISSYPKGEQRTGSYRSAPFELPQQFEFYMAGHHGFPSEQPHKKNFVRICDAATHQTLQVWYPPRNDTAQRFQLTSSKDHTERVYVEIVDGDDANAFAWLAVGRFSLAGLNPDNQSKDTAEAVRVISQFGLKNYLPLLGELLGRATDTPKTAGTIAEAIVTFNSNAVRRALASSVAVKGLTVAQRKQIVAEIVNNKNDPTMLLSTAFRVATAEEQGEMATALSSDRAGAEILVGLTGSGIAAPALLQRSLIADSLKAVAGEHLVAKIKEIVSGLPEVSADLEQRIKDRKIDFMRAGGNAQKGEALFVKNCSVCHQVAGKGRKVGPNLDGIGNRGLDRLLEDILAPSRNVDVAFRATTILKTDGKVISGLSKGTDGARLIIVDSKGEQISIPDDEIEDQVTSRRSPMPDNIDQILTEEQFHDLVAWLLTLRR